MASGLLQRIRIVDCGVINILNHLSHHWQHQDGSYMTILLSGTLVDSTCISEYICTLRQLVKLN